MRTDSRTEIEALDGEDGGVVAVAELLERDAFAYRPVKGFAIMGFEPPSSETFASRICEGASGVQRIVIRRAIAGQ